MSISAASLSELHEDAKRVVLQLVDAGSLIKFKCVNQLWRKLARNELCSRLCHREGAQITDLNVELLDSAGRPWEAATAGRLLPGLARLHGYGFVVDVAAVREVDLEEDEIVDTVGAKETTETDEVKATKAAQENCQREAVRKAAEAAEALKIQLKELQLTKTNPANLSEDLDFQMDSLIKGLAKTDEENRKMAEAASKESFTTIP